MNYHSFNYLNDEVVVEPDMQDVKMTNEGKGTQMYEKLQSRQ